MKPCISSWPLEAREDDAVCADDDRAAVGQCGAAEQREFGVGFDFGPMRAEVGGFVDVSAQTEGQRVIAFVAEHAEHGAVVRKLDALPRLAVVVRLERAAALADDDESAAARARDGVEMRRGFLADLQILRAEGHLAVAFRRRGVIVVDVVVFFRGRFVAGRGDGHRRPMLAAVVGAQREAVRADGHAVLRIGEQHAEQRRALLRIARRFVDVAADLECVFALQRPVFAAVAAVRDHAFVADRPHVRIDGGDGGECRARRNLRLLPCFRVGRIHDLAAPADGDVAIAGFREGELQRIRHERHHLGGCIDRIGPRMRVRARKRANRRTHHRKSPLPHSF